MLTIAGLIPKRLKRRDTKVKHLIIIIKPLNLLGIRDIS